MSVMSRISGISMKTSVWNRAGAASLILLFLFLFSCINEEREEDILLPSEDSESALVTINIPALGFGDNLQTRDGKVTDEAENGEGQLQSLYLVIFKQDLPKVGEQVKDFYHFETLEIKSAATIDGNITPDQRKYYSTRLGIGNYKFYLLANIEEYWKLSDYPDFEFITDSQSEEMQATDAEGRTVDSPFVQYISASEENIKNIKLHFNGLIQNGHLPMICLTENICSDNQGKNKLENGVFPISDGNVKNKDNLTVYAPLSFLCSKVRLTVLFDNSPVGNGNEAGFSKAFSESDINFTTESHINPETGEIYYQTANEKGIRWDNLRGEIVVNQVLLNNGDDSEAEDKPEEDIFSYIFKTQYPGQGSKYLTIENQDDGEPSPEYLERMSPVDNWNPATQRAWQSYAMYIPENLFDNQGTTNKYTMMHLAPSGTGVKVEGYYIYLNKQNPGDDRYGITKGKYGNARGTFYDIVAKMKEPTAFSLEVKIHVNAWAYHEVGANW